MPRGPGKPSNYNLNYSRFNGVDEEGEGPATAKSPNVPPLEGVPDIRELLRNMPPELQEAYRLMMISRESGDKAAQERANELALKAVQRGSPEVQKQFMSELSNHSPEAAQAIGRELQVEQPQDLDNVSSKIDALRSQMEEGQKAARQQMDMLERQQEQLENLHSPEDFISFFQEGGMREEDLQRILTGDQAHMEMMVSSMLEKTTSGQDNLKQVETQVKAAETLHRSIIEGKEPVDSPDGVDDQKVTPSPKPYLTKEQPTEPTCLIPDHRLQYHKDENGRYSTVELKCSLPGIKDIDAIALDVSEKYLRLNTQAPKYAVNAGPFPVLIEPGAARAKFSKKREELSILVPAKA